MSLGLFFFFPGRKGEEWAKNLFIKIYDHFNFFV